MRKLWLGISRIWNYLNESLIFDERWFATDPWQLDDDKKIQFLESCWKLKCSEINHCYRQEMDKEES